MRYDAEQKDRTRAKVLAEAARLVRVDGPAKLSVNGVMAAAGLTHGGFYAHFASRDALLAEALSQAFLDSLALLDRATEKGSPREAIAYYVKAYLSPRHRDAEGLGCPLPSIGSDAVRLPTEARACFQQGQENLLKRFRDLMRAADISAPADFASSVQAELVGALTMARAAGNGEASNRILRNSRNAILARLSLSDLAA